MLWACCHFLSKQLQVASPAGDLDLERFLCNRVEVRKYLEGYGDGRAAMPVRKVIN